MRKLFKPIAVPLLDSLDNRLPTRIFEQKKDKLNRLFSRCADALPSEIFDNTKKKFLTKISKGEIPTTDIETLLDGLDSLSGLLNSFNNSNTEKENISLVQQISQHIIAINTLASYGLFPEFEPYLKFKERKESLLKKINDDASLSSEEKQNLLNKLTTEITITFNINLTNQTNGVKVSTYRMSNFLTTE